MHMIGQKRPPGKVLGFVNTELTAALAGYRKAGLSRIETCVRSWLPPDFLLPLSALNVIGEKTLIPTGRLA